MSGGNCRWQEAYVGLGSNLKDPCQQLGAAYVALAQLPSVQLLASSRWYPSLAVGPGEQPDYVNAVVRIKTHLSPHEFLDALQSIEQAQGRERLIRWGARTLDLDILLFGKKSIATDRLTVPHAHLADRNFVVFPLMDLCPEAVLPDGRILADIASELTEEGLGEPINPNLKYPDFDIFKTDLKSI